MDTNALQIRLNLLEGLTSYAANLSILVGNSSTTNLDKNTTTLGQALITVDKDFVNDSFFKTAPVTTQDLKIFTAAINTLGHWLIAHEQQKEAKQVISSMQEPITNICHLLQRDFHILGQQVVIDDKQTLENENQNILNNLAHFDNDPGEKRAEIQDMAALVRAKKNDADLFEAMESAIVKLEAAHTSLEEVFTKHTTNINSLIKELSTESQRISKYYSSLKNSQ